MLLFETANVPQLRLSDADVRVTIPVNLLPISGMSRQVLFNCIDVDCNILFPLFYREFSKFRVSTSTDSKVGLGPALLPSVPAAPWSPFAPVLPVIPIIPLEPVSPLAPLIPFPLKKES